MNCLLCNQRYQLRSSWHQLFSWGPLEESTICPECQGRFVAYSEPHCPGCGRTNENQSLCQECQQWDQKLGWHLQHRCLWQYNSAMKEYMHRYKFQGDYLLRNVFKNNFTKQIREVGADVVCPVPISDLAWQTRGFNQVSGLIDMPIKDLLATKPGKRRAQSSRNREERLAISQPFCWKNEACLDEVAGKMVLVVDDVYTTGRTMYYAAALIREGGVKSVKTLSLAG